MRSHPRDRVQRNAVQRDTVVRAWARLVKAQQSALLSIEHALKSAKLPPLAWYDALLELERAGFTGSRYDLSKNTYDEKVRSNQNK